MADYDLLNRIAQERENDRIALQKAERDKRRQERIIRQKQVDLAKRQKEMELARKNKAKNGQSIDDDDFLEEALRDLLDDEANTYTLLKEDLEEEGAYKSGAEEMAPKGMQWVYVVIIHAKAATSSVIQHFTGDPYNHAMLSFDKSMTKVYSFVMKRGLEVANLKKDYKDNAEFVVYKIAIPIEVVVVMKDAISEIQNSRRKYNFSYMGLLGFLVNKKYQHKFNTNKKRLFCSQFVSKMFLTAGMDIFDGKHDYEIKPYDFARNKKFRLCYKGDIRTFDHKKIR